MDKVRIVRSDVEMDAQEFWSNLLGSGWETWSWWHSVNYSEGSDWNIVGEVTIEIENPYYAPADDKDESSPEYIKKTLSLFDLVVAYEKCVETGSRFDIDDFDAMAGDEVLQTAVLGDVVYG